MPKTAEEIRLEKMASDPNWAKNAQKQIDRVSKDFDMPAPKRSMGIGPPEPESRPKPRRISAGIASQTNGLINVSERKQLMDLFSEEEQGKGGK